MSMCGGTPRAYIHVTPQISVLTTHVARMWPCARAARGGYAHACARAPTQPPQLHRGRGATGP